MKKEKKIKVTFTMDRDLVERWREVSKKIKVSRSAMLREILEEILPVLENETPHGIVKSAMIKNAEYQKELANSLFKDLKKD